MNNIIIRYGIKSAILICTLSLIGWSIGNEFSYAIQEIWGYTSMIISLLFIFFGIRHYRNTIAGGVISYKKAILIGVLIALIAALAFGVLDVIYVKYINPNFMNEYYMHYVEQTKNQFSGIELQSKLKELESQKELFANPLANFLVMFSTVMIIGFIISLLSALLLHQKPINKT